MRSRMPYGSMSDSSRARSGPPPAMTRCARKPRATLTENADASSELTYLQRLYDAGARGTFDVLALQAYGLRGGPDG